MSPRRRRAALVYVSCWAAAATLRVLWMGRVTPTTEGLALLAAVPTAQIALLECATAVRRWTAPRRNLSGLARFFLLWVVLTLALLLASIGIAVAVFRDIDLTGGAMFSTVFIPALQAAVLVLPFGGQRRWTRVCIDVIAQPLARPILWLDAIMLTAGLALLHDPQIGVASAAPIQRHWVGTKFMAAALFFGAEVRRAGRGADTRGRPVALAGLAVALAGVGLHAFTPWILTVADHVPRPVGNQPQPILWLEMYGALFAGLLVFVLRSAPALERASPAAARLVEAATLMLFFATLALLTNGALSLQPVSPWAPIALLTASASATLFAWAAILAHAPSDQPTLRAD